MSVPPFETQEIVDLPQDVLKSWLSVCEARAQQLRMSGTDQIPCGWFDMETRTCRHYESRPSICRNFDRGNEACRDMREMGGLSF